MCVCTLDHNQHKMNFSFPIGFQKGKLPLANFLQKGSIFTLIKGGKKFHSFPLCVLFAWMGWALLSVANYIYILIC